MGSTGGAYVVLLTAPCFNSGEQPNGTALARGRPGPTGPLQRRCVRAVAAEHPATVRVEDFGAMVCPGGVYSTTRDGVLLRDGDGVHIVPTPAAGQWLAAHLLPAVVQRRPAPDGGAQPRAGTRRRTTAAASVSASGTVAASGTRGP